MTAQQRRESYACDVTYVTNSELGFDYLRDNLATSKADLVVPSFNFCIIDEVDSILIDEARTLTPFHSLPRRLPSLTSPPPLTSKVDLVVPSFNFCIIDEVDSILIDEARTPLIISGPAEKPSERYLVAAKIAAAFERDVHYTTCYEEAELVLKLTDLYAPKQQWAPFLLNTVAPLSSLPSLPTRLPSLRADLYDPKQQWASFLLNVITPSSPFFLSFALFLSASSSSFPLPACSVDEKQKVVLLTEIGYEEAELVLKVTDLYDPKEQWASFLLNAIKAKELFAKDVQYIVRDGAVLIVDEFTGRIMEGRRWSEGVHQAVEAKEGVAIQNETVSLASISYQNFFLQVGLCGVSEGVHEAVEAKEGVGIQNETLFGVTGLAATEAATIRQPSPPSFVPPAHLPLLFVPPTHLPLLFVPPTHLPLLFVPPTPVSSLPFTLSICTGVPPKLCGMNDTAAIEADRTGTAATEADEFESIYKLAVAEVPTNRPLQRKDEQDVVYRTSVGKWRAVVADVKGRHAEEQPDEQDVVYRTSVGKWKAVVADVKGRHAEGRPVLVGTTSVEISEALSAKLKEANVPHQVLNAKPENVEREAEIVAQSGRVGAVTIATNMAGRGTDILLGGNAEFMARLKLREALMPSLFPCPLSPDLSNAVNEAVQAAVQAWGSESVLFHSLPSYAHPLPSCPHPHQVPPSLFPCPLSPDLTNAVNEAVQAAVQAWGSESVLFHSLPSYAHPLPSCPHPHQVPPSLFPCPLSPDFSHTVNFETSQNSTVITQPFFVLQVPASLFPCPLSPDLTDAVNEAVQAAVEAWGSSALTALEAEDRLAFACEKVRGGVRVPRLTLWGPTSDPVVKQLRAAFEAGPTADPVVKQLRAAFEAVEGEYRRFTEEEKRKVIAAGGLHVIGTERHESRRVDNQRHESRHVDNQVGRLQPVYEHWIF
ncbi:unnamed protein product [Closterium sp. Naga37s-1]|nr:unnamed protein product [Closterium sp. Naga37s-1]